MKRMRLVTEPAAPTPPPARLPFVAELVTYFGRFRQFTRRDWIVYVAWVGLIFGLFASSFAFLWFGTRAGAAFPVDAWLLPAGALMFTASIAVDTIGHRTVYKEYLRGGEALVHHIIIAAGIGSCVLLCLAYPQRAAFAVPAAILTALSFIYSFVDEIMHWRRYLSQRSDAVEMWSHVGILTGHGIMMAGWWRWYLGGYQGVPEALRGLGLG